jgi:hypothetical protein
MLLTEDTKGFFMAHREQKKIVRGTSLRSVGFYSSDVLVSFFSEQYEDLVKIRMHFPKIYEGKKHSSLHRPG